MNHVAEYERLPLIRRVLLIEDSPCDALLIRKTLEKSGMGKVKVTHVVDMASAMQQLGKKKFDVALLDLSLPDTAGFDGLSALRHGVPELPVIILTAYADEELALRAVEHGAQDYLFKDVIDGMGLQRSMQYARQRKQFEATLITQANFDALTGLANRILFESRLDMALARLQRNHSALAVFFIDLNRFKRVNDSLGHAAGDDLLQQVGACIKNCLRPYDTAARLSGDEFAVLVEGVEEARDCAAIAQKILEQLQAPFSIAGREITISASIGIASCHTGDRVSREELMQQADEAMYTVKAADGGYQFYTHDLQLQALTRIRQEEEIVQALLERQFSLHYQPKLDLRNGKVRGAEALLRWNHPEQGMILPAEFMGLVHEAGMEEELGDWVLCTVCNDIRRWERLGYPIMQVSVNLFLSQLDNEEFPDALEKVLQAYKIDPSHLALEVPSIALMEDIEFRMGQLRRMHELGVMVQLDHFGAAPISLASLTGTFFSTIKISPELTHQIDQRHSEPHDLSASLRVILEIARYFDIPVEAVGIESEEQHAFYRDSNCGVGQGMSLCKPLPGEELEAWLSRQQQAAASIPK